MTAEGEDQPHTDLMEVMEGMLPSHKRSIEEDAPATHSKLARGKGKGHGKPSKKAKDLGHSEELLHMIARLLISHEDTLLAILQESEFMLFMQANGAGSLGPTMLALSQKWHALTATEATPKTPLRVVMGAAVFKELELRVLKAMGEDEEGAHIRKKLMTQNLLTADGKSWNYMKWNQEQGKLLPTKEAPLPMCEACQMLNRVYALIQTPGLILRFCALKALKRVDMDSTSSKYAIVPWKLTVSMRSPQAAELFQALNRLSHNAVMQVILSRLRPGNLQRSPLAQTIAKQIFRD